uniref:Uncharacterized protein n=1 Tax=Fagus sylvatica TaxID=28930 RepID=A0A2N9G576_FAGSY
MIDAAEQVYTLKVPLMLLMIDVGLPRMKFWDDVVADAGVAADRKVTAC